MGAEVFTGATHSHGWMEPRQKSVLGKHLASTAKVPTVCTDCLDPEGHLGLLCRPSLPRPSRPLHCWSFPAGCHCQSQQSSAWAASRDQRAGAGFRQRPRTTSAGRQRGADQVNSCGSGHRISISSSSQGTS